MVLWEENRPYPVCSRFFPAGKNIDAELGKLHRMSFAQTKTVGRSFSVCDHQVDRLLFPEFLQVLDGEDAGLAYDLPKTTRSYHRE